MDLLIMTGSKLRHLYFASAMLKQFQGARVLIEEFFEETGKNYVPEETPLMKEHFKEFALTEWGYFFDIVQEQRALLEENVIKRIKPGTINDADNVELIRKLNPRVIAVHSTSIIRQELIQAFPRRIINLHAGLSPYYRGAGTNLFPFYNEELEFVGMTVHYLDEGIDSGDIILQGRPEFEEGDNTHTIGCKDVILGTELMVRVIRKFLGGKLPPSRSQDLSKGRLYLKKHFNDGVLNGIKLKLLRGMVETYISNPRRVEIVEWQNG